MRRLMVAVVIAVSVLTSCAGESPEVPLGADGQVDAELTLGRDVYTRRCANCHGGSGGGGTGPAIGSGLVVEAYPEAADQRAVIADGQNGMPSFAGSLSSEEIDAVVRYTREVLS